MNARAPYINRKVGIVIYREPSTGEFHASVHGWTGWMVLRATTRAEAIAEAKDLCKRGEPPEVTP